MLKGRPNPEFIAMRDQLIPNATADVRDQLTYLLVAVSIKANPVREQRRAASCDSAELAAMTLVGAGLALNALGLEASQDHLASACEVTKAYEKALARMYGSTASGISQDQILTDVVVPAAAYLKVETAIFGRTANVVEYLNNGITP